MVVCVAGGKGGTGKTLVSTSLAMLLAEAEPVQFLDCDTEAPNSHLFLRPTITAHVPVMVPVPVVDESRCVHCGECAQSCRFNAIASLPATTVVHEELCHSCGLCARVCPHNAIREAQRPIGLVHLGRAGAIEFVGGELSIGEPRASAVVGAVKSYAVRSRTVIVDAPPGTSCPVVATLKGCDLALLVTEPTPFGLGDLRLIVETTRIMGIPVATVINRSDIGDSRVLEYCEAEGIPIWCRIPHDRSIAQASARGERAIETSPPLRAAIASLIDRLASYEATRGSASLSMAKLPPNGRK